MTIPSTSGIGNTNPVIAPPKVTTPVTPQTKTPTPATTETQTPSPTKDTDETKKPAPTTGVDKPLPVAFTPISPEVRKVLNELMADPKITAIVSPAGLMAMAKEYLKSGENSNDDLMSQLVALKGASSNPESLKKAIIGFATEVNHSFHDNIQGPERFDPTLSNAQAETISKNENKLQDVGEIFGKLVDFDAGVGTGTGKTNPEAQGTTPGTGTATTPPAKQSIGDILTEKLAGIGFHLNFDIHSSKSGVKLPAFLINELKSATTKDQAMAIMDKLVSYLKDAGAIKPNTGNGATQTGSTTKTGGG